MYYYQHHIGDYLKHTAHLTPLEDIAYRRLLDVYYDTEAPIPTDIPLVSRRLRIDPATVKLVLDEYFQLTEDGYRNKRADVEIAAYHSFLQKQKANGIKGGRPKVEPTGNPRDSQAKPKITLTENHEPLTNNQEPITNNHKKEEIGAPSAAAVPPVRAAVPRGTRLPLDFVLSESWGEWALQEQKTWSPEHVHKVAEKFADHWRAAPGSRGVKLDWQATWRNWVRNEGAMRADQKPKLTLMEVMDREDQNAA